MKISIVTISYNQAPFLRECIDSVLTQDHQDLEYIVVDPGSTDGSREIIDSYDLRIVRVFERDAGPADGLNRGFERATGQIYGYINADDRLIPGALRKVSEFFESRSDSDIVLGHGYHIDQIGRRVENLFSTMWSPRLYAYGFANAVQQSTFFRSDAFRRAGGFNTNNTVSWDGELLVDMTLAGANVRVLNEYLSEFRIYPESITGSGRLKREHVINRQRIAEKILGRKATPVDWVWSRALRAYKIFRYPRRSFYKATTRACRAICAR